MLGNACAVPAPRYPGYHLNEQLTSMHRMHRILSGNDKFPFVSIFKPAPDQIPSRLLVQLPPVLDILCILCIDVNNEK